MRQTWRRRKGERVAGREGAREEGRSPNRLAFHTVDGSQFKITLPLFQSGSLSDGFCV